MKKNIEKFSIINNEIDEIKKKIEDSETKYEEKKAELQQANEKIKKLDDEIDDLEIEKSDKYDNKKSKIENIFGIIHLSNIAFFAVAGSGIALYILDSGLPLFKIVTLILIPAIGISLVEEIVRYIIIKRTISKIQNSEEYKNLIEKIKVKEKEVDKAEEIVILLEKELSNIEKELNNNKDKLENKLSEIRKLKDEIVEKVIKMSANSDEKNKPLRRVRTKEN